MSPSTSIQTCSSRSNRDITPPFSNLKNFEAPYGKGLTAPEVNIGGAHVGKQTPSLSMTPRTPLGHQGSGGRLLVVCDNRTCMCNILSEINYCLGNRLLVISLTNLADLYAGKRSEEESVWFEARYRGEY